MTVICCLKIHTVLVWTRPTLTQIRNRRKTFIQSLQGTIIQNSLQNNDSDSSEFRPARRFRLTTANLVLKIYNKWVKGTRTTLTTCKVARSEKAMVDTCLGCIYQPCCNCTLVQGKENDSVVVAPRQTPKTAGMEKPMRSLKVSHETSFLAAEVGL